MAAAARQENYARPHTAAARGNHGQGRGFGPAAHYRGGGGSGGSAGDVIQCPSGFASRAGATVRNGIETASTAA